MKDTQNKKPVPAQNITNGHPVNAGISAGPIEARRPVSEFIKPSEEQSKIDGELEAIGVEQNREEAELDETQKQAGITHSPAHTPVRTEPTGIVQLPMTEEEVKDAMAQYKNKVTYDIGQHGEHDAYVVASRLGLATLVDKINKFISMFKPKKRATA